MNISDVVKKLLTWTSLKVEIELRDDPNFYFHEREIWWVSLGANVGYEQDGKNSNFERPVLVLKKFNRFVFWAVPLTSTLKNNQYYFTTEYDEKEYSIILSQVRLLSSKRLLRKVRTLPEEEFIEVKERIKDFL